MFCDVFSVNHLMVWPMQEIFQLVFSQDSPLSLIINDCMFVISATIACRILGLAETFLFCFTVRATRMGTCLLNAMNERLRRDYV